MMERNGHPYLSLREVMVETGATERQLRFWATRGLLDPLHHQVKGKRSRLWFDEADQARAHAIAALVNLGVRFERIEQEWRVGSMAPWLQALRRAARIPPPQLTPNDIHVSLDRVG